LRKLSITLFTFQAVNEAAKGALSPESCALFSSLKDPLRVPPGELVVKLYATNQEVDVENTNSVIEVGVIIW
jgi:hypothetical protein